MKRLLIILCFPVTVVFAQPGTPAPPRVDTINFLNNWKHYLYSGEYTYDEYRALVDSFVEFDSEDTIQKSLYKDFQRNQWYYKPRLSVDANGNFDFLAYEKSFKSYLETEFCEDSELPEEPWSLIGPIGTQAADQSLGLITAVHIDPNDINKILIGSNAAGIWRTTNKGQNWDPVTDNLGFPVLGISSFAADPNNANVIFASTGISHSFLNMIGVGLLKSTDAGQSWNPVTTLNLGNTFMNITKVVYDVSYPNRMYLTTDRSTDKRLFKSENGGSTWQQVQLGLPNGTIGDIITLENGKVYISIKNDLGDHTIYYTTNHGTTLTAIDWIPVDFPAVFFDYDFSTLPNPGPWSATPGQPDVFQNPAGSFWSITDFGSGEGLSFIPQAANQTYGTSKVFNIYTNPNSPYQLSLIAHKPANTVFKIYGIHKYGSTYIDDLIYTNSNLSAVDFNLSNHPINFNYTKYSAIKIVLETDSSFVNTGDHFWIKYFAFKAIESKFRLYKVPETTNRFLVSQEISTTRNVYRSLDGGANFETRLSSSTADVTGGMSKMEVAELISDDDVYISGGVGYFRFVNGVSSTTCYICHADARAIQNISHPTISNQDVIVMGTDGGVSLSEDGGLTWSNITGDLANSLVYSIDVHEQSELVMGGYQDNATMILDNNTLTSTCNGDGSVAYIDPSSNTKTISGDPQDPNFCYGSGWASSLSLMHEPMNEDTYLGMPLESSFAMPEIVLYGLDRTDEDNSDQPHSKLIEFNTSIPTNPAIIYDFDSGSGLSTNQVNSICVSESEPNRVLVSLNALYEFNLYKIDRSLSSGNPNQIVPLFTPVTTVLQEPGTSIGSAPMPEVLDNNYGRDIRDIAISHSTSEKVWLAVGGTIINGSGAAVHEKWRVLYSENSGEGTIWYDYSEGLPGLPVNTILYIDGYNDLLFVGTDAGVYYRNADMDQWECFNNGFPLAVVTDLEFDYCHKTLYASTFGRSIYKCEIPFDLGGGDGASAELVIAANTTWNTDMSIRQTVRILPGKTLTVTATIDMLTDKKIIVEQGAKLIIQGGTLTNLCDGFWGGVEVWGTSNQSQFGTAQGEVVMSNSAKIEHAEVAIALWKPSDWAATGGIIRAYNSVFKNNKKDVEFISYSNDHSGTHYANKGQFTDCNFYWDDEFRTEIPLAHATLYRVDGVKFLGCSFADKRTAGSVPLSPNIIGIKSIDASYRVWGRCTGTGTCTGEVGAPGSLWDPGIFENLYFGIYATNVSSTYAINVDRCIFVDNGYGILVSAMPSPVIVRSKFEFTNLGTHAFTPFTMHGIHAVNSKLLKIEENKFIDSSPGGNSTFGVVSSDLGEQEEKIRKNSFTGLTYANFAQGNNGNSDSIFSSGLYFPCNSNTMNKSDHNVVSTLWGLSSTSPGVRPVSGSALLPTGSSFSADPGNLIHNEDYSNSSTQGISYFHQSSQVPDDFSLFTVDMNLTTQSNPCLTTLTNYQGGVGKLTVGDKSSYVSQFNSASSAIISKENAYRNLLLDASETTNIITAINGLTVNNKTAVRNMLISYSPYLTTEILFELADNSSTNFDHAWLRDMLLANIEAVTPQLLLFLQTKSDPLPANMRLAVSNAVGTTYTQRTVRETEISQLYADRAFYSYQIITGFVQDTAIFNTDSLRHWIGLQNNILSQQLIIDSYLQDGNYSSAELVNDAYELYANASTTPSHLRPEASDFVELKNWLFPILQTPGEIASLDETKLNYLRDKALNGKGTARYQAQNILCFFYNECDYYYFEAPTDTRAFEMETELVVSEEQPVFKIYPNPANDMVMIELSPESYELLENGEILITDLTGKVVFQTNLTQNTYLWETGSVQTGIYLVMIKSNNELFDTQKVIINRQ